MRKWDVRRYTITQLLVALDRTDPSDPHAGNVPIGSLAELDRLAAEM